MIPTPPRFSRLPLAAVGALLLSTSAPAAVIYYSGIVDIPIPTTFNGVYLDIGTQVASTPSNESPSVQNDTYTVGYNQPSSWDINIFFGGIGIAYSDTFQPFVDDTVSNRSQILNVVQGTVIIDEAVSRTLGTAAFGGSGRSNQSTGDSHFDIPDLDSDPAYSAFTPGAEGYIAFVLNPGIDEFYGWLRVTLTNDGTVGTIHDWAYSSDSGFTVGQVPEPAAALIGSLGLLMLLRRRR
jgi:hypothetical protein